MPPEHAPSPHCRRRPVPRIPHIEGECQDYAEQQHPWVVPLICLSLYWRLTARQAIFSARPSQALASFNREIAAVSNFSLVASTSSCNCSRVVALAIGAVILGRAISQAIATLAGVELFCFATCSSAATMRCPRSFMYFCTNLPRALFSRSACERYLPVRKPLASEK